MANILIVDDNEDIRNILRRSFDRYTVSAVGDGAEALDLLAAVRPDVALIDVSLPGPLSGLAVAASARAIDVAVLLMTGADPCGLNLDGFACIRKPFQLSVLHEYIKAVVGPDHADKVG